MKTNIYYVYHIKPEDHEIKKRLAGKFLLDEEGDLHVLEDHFGTLHELEGEPSEVVAKRLQSLQDSMYTDIIPLADIAQGQHPEILPETKFDTESPELVQYLYHRIGMTDPQELVFENNQATLDGHPLSDIELQKLMENVNAGRATLDRKSAELEKHAEGFRSLVKADPHLAQALNHVRTAVKAGTMPPEALKILTAHIFKDTMVPSMGNKKAYQDFLSRPRGGVHVHIDLNDFGTINKVHGFETGDSAIKAAGQAMRNAIDSSVSKKVAKAFRVGGDEFRIYVPTHEHAARLVRALKQHWDKIPPIEGTHSVSGSIGIGHTPETAENALIQAKTAKKSSGYKLGEAKTHAHSAIPNFEGPLSVD